MELTYPINFVGYERGDSSGEVVTRDGEYLGTWILFKDDVEVSGEFRFVVDGENKPLFSEVIGILDSGLRRGNGLEYDMPVNSSLARGKGLGLANCLFGQVWLLKPRWPFL